VADTDTDAGLPAEGPASGPSPRCGRKVSRAGRNLPAAILVGAVIGVSLVVVLECAPLIWIAVVAGAIFVATHEVVRRLRTAGYLVPLIPLLVGGQATVWLTWPFRSAGALAGFGGTVVVAMMWRLLSRHDRRAPSRPDGQPSSPVPASYLRDASVTVFLAAWVPLFASFGALLVYPQDGAGRGYCLMLAVISSDIGGYTVGVLFGKHPMVPAISPHKSWEGFAGSLVFGITTTALVATLLAEKPLWIGVLLGAVLVLTATLGDLVESQFKRDLGIKDMGRLLPGHGGLMDRLDGVLPSAVAAWIVLTLVP
jgi:phosphatidate cytidylyltransferase